MLLQRKNQLTAEAIVGSTFKHLKNDDNTRLADEGEELILMELRRDVSENDLLEEENEMITF